jgi:hypothetical protein
MGTFVLGLVLENVLVPLILAGSIAALSRLVPISARPPLLLGAMVLAVGASFLLAFGPPPWPPAGARTKLLLALGLAGIAGWLLDDLVVTTAGRPLRAGVILLPALWIAVPALDLGHKDGLALAALVTAAGLSSDALRPDNAARRLAAIALMALGLAWIAIFASTQSFALLALALAAASGGLLLAAPRPLPAALPLPALTLVIGLAVALSLFTAASKSAILVLTAVLAADRIAASGRFLLVATALLVLAAAIARLENGVPYGF